MVLFTIKTRLTNQKEKVNFFKLMRLVAKMEPQDSIEWFSLTFWNQFIVNEKTDLTDDLYEAGIIQIV